VTKDCVTTSPVVPVMVNGTENASWLIEKLELWPSLYHFTYILTQHQCYQRIESWRRRWHLEEDLKEPMFE
jgi:hypothetical protein